MDPARADLRACGGVAQWEPGMLLWRYTNASQISSQIMLSPSVQPVEIGKCFGFRSTVLVDAAYSLSEVRPVRQAIVVAEVRHHRPRIHPSLWVGREARRG